MRLLWLEIKRIVKSPLTICLVMAVAAFSLLLAYVPITFYSCVRDQEYLSGFEALRTMKQIRGDIEGEINHETIREAIACYQEAVNKYGAESEYDLPMDGKRDTEKYQFLFWKIREAYGSENGHDADLNTLQVDEIEEFYSVAHKHLQNKMKLEQADNPAAQKNALRMYERVNVPYVYYVGANSNVFDYEGILIFLLLLCCTVVVASVFSTDYQTGADDILRCTKQGRKKLAIIKIVSSIIITIGICVICLAIWSITTRIIWGKEGMRTSIQLLLSVINLANVSAGQLMGLLGICGTIMIISSVCLSLFISSRVSKNMVSLILSLVVCAAPMILGWVLPNGIIDYLKALFPSGGIGLQNGILYDIIDFKFLNVGQLAIWTPYLIMFFAILEIPVWILLAIRGHEKHVTH